MAVVCQRKTENEEIIYVPPVQSVLMQKSNDLVKQFSKYANAVGLASGEVCIQRAILPRVILRVDKREGYFVVFHKGTQINEIKQAALVAYWILKFKPFMVNSDDPKRVHHYSRINEGFAFFYILSACKQHAEENHYIMRDVSNRLRDEIMYAFTYWDLSKESVILMAETIGESFFGIPTQGLENDGYN